MMYGGTGILNWVPVSSCISLSALNMKTKDKLIHQFFVAGLIYCDYDKVKIKRGQKLSLVKEPDNEFDSDAISILVGKTKIGYVPRVDTLTISNFEGKVTRAVVRQYAPTNPTHRMVLVNVFGVNKKATSKNVIC